MRLNSLTGFEIRQFPNRKVDCSIEPCKLVLYTADQKEPVYISEVFTLSERCLALNNVSFADSTCGRSFRLALQFWTRPQSASNWQVKEQWILDLRQAKIQSVKSAKDLLSQPGVHVQTELGTIYLNSTCALANSSNSDRREPLMPVQSPSQVPNHLRAQIMSQLQPKCTHVQETRRHTDDGAPSHRTQANGSENNAENSIISRWIPWGRGTNNGRVVGKTSESHPGLQSLSYPTLVDLWTLQNSLDEALAASKEISTQIDESFGSSKLPIDETEAVLAKKLKHIRKCIDLVNVEARKTRQKATNLRYQQRSLDSRLKDSMHEAQLLKPRNLLAKTSLGAAIQEKIRKEQGRLATELLEIFPIELIGDGKFHFAINGLMLPSVFAINHYDTAQIGAALGFIAQVVLCLSQYLDVALPYPITVYGSQSYITDNISRIKHGSRKFPLWTRGALLYRVEYALYLLHKDIELLMTSLDLAVADLKQTLANLKNVLLVLSSEYRQSAKEGSEE